MKRLFFAVIFVFAFGMFGVCHAQSERGDIRRGNTQFKLGNFVQAEVDYKRALSKDSTSLASVFNLAGALYKQKRMEDATALYGALAKQAAGSFSGANTGGAGVGAGVSSAGGVDSVAMRRMASVLYNQGNALLEQRKVDEAIQSYKSSLRLNPADRDAKFNLAFAQKLMQKPPQDSSQNKQDQQQPQSQPNPQDQQQKDQQSKPHPQQPQQQSADNERTLRAVQADEDRAARQMEQRKREQAERNPTGGGGKMW